MTPGQRNGLKRIRAERAQSCAPGPAGDLQGGTRERVNVAPESTPTGRKTIKLKPKKRGKSR